MYLQLRPSPCFPLRRLVSKYRQERASIAPSCLQEKQGLRWLQPEFTSSPSPPSKKTKAPLESPPYGRPQRLELQGNFFSNSANVAARTSRRMVRLWGWIFSSLS